MLKRIALSAITLVTVSAIAQKPDFKAFQKLEVNKLETACDCGEAFIQGAEIEIYFLNNAKKYKYRQEKESKQVIEWNEQMKSIQNHCVREKKHKPEDIKKCPNVQMIIDLRERKEEEFLNNKTKK